MDIASTLFGIRCQAMAYAMSTATVGEPVVDILARAMLYAEWMSEPITTRTASDAMGEPPTARVQ